MILLTFNVLITPSCVNLENQWKNSHKKRANEFVSNKSFNIHIINSTNKL
jgi:hypothetical protein